MELFNCPNEDKWKERKNFLETLIDEFDIHEVSLVSDHATALFMDLQACFCTGAWLSVIIVAVSVIDAHLRDIHDVSNNVPINELLKIYYKGDDADWLRKLRNSYVHLNVEKTSLIVNIQFDDRARLENDARRAIRMVVSALFQD